MRKILIFLVFLFGVSVSKAQIFDLDSMGEVLKKEIPAGYDFRKLQEINGRSSCRREIEYGYFFSKDSIYSLDLRSVEGSAKGIVMVLFDSTREQINTSFRNNFFSKSLSFQPTESGTYYVRFAFKDSHHYQGVSVLSVKAKNMNPRDPEHWIEQALKSKPQEYYFIKSFKMHPYCSGCKTIEYTCVFSEKTNYRIDLSNTENTKILLVLYNSNREIIATNEKKGVFEKVLKFKCPKTSIYYIRYKFMNRSGLDVGGAAFSFYRNPNYKSLKKPDSLNSNLSEKIIPSVSKPKITPNLAFEKDKMPVQLIQSQDESTEKPFLLFPNPTQDKIQIQFLVNVEKLEFSLYDSQEKQILEGKVERTKNEIHLSGFPAGVYLLNLQSEQKIWREKIILEK